ncbi:MAG: hypothetical protein ACR2PG_00730 [Hyphomicrobiaceae bacterium]
MSLHVEFRLPIALFAIEIGILRAIANVTDDQKRFDLYLLQLLEQEMPASCLIQWRTQQ